MEGYITITKKGRKQRVSEEAFKNWGKDKNGWEVVHNETTVDNTVKLPTGETIITLQPPAEQKVDNTAPKAQDGQPVGNTTTTDNQAKKENKTTSNKEEFEKALDGLNRSNIKELLEKPTINKPYDKKAKAEDLKALLGEALGYDVARLQKELE